MTRLRRQRRDQTVPTMVCMDRSSADGYDEAKSFVVQAFSAAYGARLTHFMPNLMALRDDNEKLLAVLGIRETDAAPLFLEHYLDCPIEQCLSAAMGSAVDRKLLVEVGNFAVGAAGGGRWLITALTAYLHAARKVWAVFTCGPELQNAFRRLGIELLDLGFADPDRLSFDELSRWGRYYEQRPRVMAANVARSHHTLSQLFEKECALNALWRRAGQAGRLTA